MDGGRSTVGVRTADVFSVPNAGCRPHFLVASALWLKKVAAEQATPVHGPSSIVEIPHGISAEQNFSFPARVAYLGVPREHFLASLRGAARAFFI